jgi:hypothetical protein
MVANDAKSLLNDAYDALENEVLDKKAGLSLSFVVWCFGTNTH